jgi:hypothetical protein
MKSLFLLPVLALSASLFAAEPAAPANPHVGMKLPTAMAPREIPLTQQATVLSTISVPQYTYIEAAQGKKTVWLAASSMAVKKGDTIRFDDGMVMNNFYSKTLKRTFPNIVFVNRAVVGGDKKK